MMDIEAREWSSVSAKALNKPVTKDQNGVKIHFMLSPSDVPAAWRSLRETAPGHPDKFIIEFKYLSAHEPTRIETREAGVSLEVGKKSKKIYKIILDSASLCGDRSEVQVEIKMSVVAQHALEKTAKESDLNSGNLDAITRFLQPAANLFQGLRHIY